uniref:Archaemetzincin-2 n=1 Tax=Crassostrea virginica TaxID=6565 RepID=A0A8B8DJG2_CRAVI|nr:archaemetzincin-2-like isoform X2 [Crassostrea virginica]
MGASSSSAVDVKLLKVIGIKMLPDKEKSSSKCRTVHEKVPSEKNARFMYPDSESFKQKKKSKSGEWLAQQKESGQNFNQFLSHINRPGCHRKILYLIPLIFEEEPVPANILRSLSEYAAIFFGLPVKIGKKRNMFKDVPNRINEHTHNFQVDASAVLDKMEVPSDAFCVAGITLCDLYPQPSWNFVFGLANMSKSCGVYSLARYLSNFGYTRNTVYKPEEEKGGEATFIRRACKVMCHEIGHMYGIHHCVFFECLMNGSNHLQEADTGPSFLCPVCLNKLYYVMKFDIEERYRKMVEFWRSHSLMEEDD